MKVTLQPQHQLKLSQLRILIAVADRQNFTEAALHLDMSQSAVSHAIAALEELLGVVLFLRGRHGAHLTSVGEQIVPHAREMVQRAEAIAKAAEQARGLSGGQVRLAAFRSVAIHLLPSVIAQFHDRFPAIAVSLLEYDDYPEIERALATGEADIGFTFMPPSPEFDSREVLQDEFVAILSPEFKLKGDRLTWAELAAQPLILPPADSMTTQRVLAHAQSSGYQLRVLYEVSTDAAIVSLVAQGLGGTILPRLAAEPIPPTVQVHKLPVPLTRVISVVVLAVALHPPAVYAFLDLLKQQNRAAIDRRSAE